MSERGSRRSDGFTLLEVLVAFAILSIALGAILKTFSSNLIWSGQAETEEEAIAVAQSVLAEVGSNIPLRDGEETGQSIAGIRWRVRMRPYTGSDGPSPLKPYTVSVSVHWGAGDSHSYSLTSLRLAPGEGTP